MNRRIVVAAITAGIVIASGFAIIILWPRTADEISVDGGILTDTQDGALEIRCIAPEIAISLAGYEGPVTVRNCVPESVVEGFGGEVSWSGKDFSFEAEGTESIVRIVPPSKTEFSFVVIGDSQGHNNILQAIVETIQDCEFVIHCGDITPSGRDTEFAAAEAVFNESAYPIYTTPGNHDVKTDGDHEYTDRFGPVQYCFDYAGIRFAFIDTSDLNFTESQADWLRDVFDGVQERVVVTHVPAFDPFEDSHTLWGDSCQRFLDLADELGFRAVFNGHIHAFNHTLVGDTDITITGGAGGTLTDGNHHFVTVTVSGDTMSFEKTDVEMEFTPGSGISMTGRDGAVLNVTFEELAEMDMVEGDSSYENYFGNIGGIGYYVGVSMTTLVELVGGMDEGDVLTVTASDGYEQTYGYLNVYPNETWLDAQGVMVLTLECDDYSVPEWDGGPRMVMLPSDGLYSNEDCELTSYYGQGYWIYPSAGARWVSSVSAISISAAVTA